MTGSFPSVGRRRLDGEAVATWTLVVFTEFLLVAGYLAFTPTAVEHVRYVVYPFVWINVGALAATSVDTNPQNRRHWAVGVLVAIAYYVVLLATASNVNLAPATTDWSMSVSMATPGWGPLLSVTGPGFTFTPIPFEALGYAALAYLLYANVLRISRSVLAGALGLVSCVGCTVPILAPAVGLLGGPAASLTSMAYQYSYDLGTLLYVVTVAILYVSATGGVPTTDRLKRGGGQ